MKSLWIEGQNFDVSPKSTRDKRPFQPTHNYGMDIITILHVTLEILHQEHNLEFLIKPTID